MNRSLVLLLLGVVGFALAIAASHVHEKWKNRLRIPGVVLLVIVVVLIAAQAMLSEWAVAPNPATPAGAISASAATTTSGSAHLEASSSVTPTAGSTVPQTPASPVRQELLLKDAVEKECSLWDQDPIAIAGESYDDGISTSFYRPGDSCWVDFLRPHWAQILEISAGVLDNSPSAAHQIQVTILDSVTNEIVLEEAVSLGQPIGESLYIADRLRIRIRMTVVNGPDFDKGTFGFSGEWR